MISGLRTLVPLGLFPLDISSDNPVDNVDFFHTIPSDISFSAPYCPGTISYYILSGIPESIYFLVYPESSILYRNSGHLYFPSYKKFGLLLTNTYYKI